MMRRFTHIARLLVPLAIGLATPVCAHADGILDRIGKMGTTISNTFKHGNSDKAAQEVRKPKGKVKSTAVPEVDPYELSFDENIATPSVGSNSHEAVVLYMNEVAKRLARRKVARIETMRSGEVVVATLSSDLLFAPNDTTLRATATEILSPYRSLLNGVNLYKLLVSCHTDDTGSAAYTDRLSEARVVAIDRFLSRNLPEDVVVVPYAMGASMPLKENDSYANRAGNRRIEIFIVPTETMISLAKAGKLNLEPSN